MTRYLWPMVMIVGSALAQVATPAPPPSAPSTATPSTAVPAAPAPTTSAPTPTSDDDASRKQAPTTVPDIIPPELPGGKVGLVRGVLKKLDPIHDQLLIKVFGDGVVRINFDPRTQLLPANASTHLTSLPTGSVLAVDTVIDRGKLFARTVRTVSSDAAELTGQIVPYDPTRSRLLIHDPMSPQSVSLQVNASTVVVNRGQPASAQTLSAGMLVQVWFSPAQKAASRIEILAERGNSFTFQGRVVSVDLRTHSVAVSNDTDQNVHEIAIGSLDHASLGLLREGADVTIQAEFDGDRYNARTVSLVSRNP